MKNQGKILTIVGLLLGILMAHGLVAQTNGKPSEQEMASWLDKALGKLETGSFSIRFEGITMKAKSPLDIFRLPNYMVFKGGYYYCDKDKFEMNMGGMKAICDGKVLVLIDEIEKQMMIDSVPKGIVSDTEMPMEDMLKKIGPQFSEGVDFRYKGVEKLKGENCHVLSAALKAAKAAQESLYFISIKTGELVLMAEKTELLYDIYWVSKISDAPLKHSYNVYLPNKEVKQLYGYEVTDLRF
jgi:hypothetical protein